MTEPTVGSAPRKSSTPSSFTAEDLHLLESALRLVPDLLSTAVFGKLARSKLTYPVNSHDELQPLFAEPRPPELQQAQLDFAKVKTFFPKELFPIDSEQELLAKVYLSFCIGKESHARTRRYVDFSRLVKELNIPADEARKLPIPQ